jgi:hypothetical protein
MREVNIVGPSSPLQRGRGSGAQLSVAAAGPLRGPPLQPCVWPPNGDWVYIKEVHNPVETKKGG